MTHYYTVSEVYLQKVGATYPLGLEVSSPQAVMVFVEVHHLKAIELAGYLFDLLLFSGLGLLDAFGIPFDVVGHGD